MSLMDLYNRAVAIYECDEASGNLVDFIEGFDLTQTGTVGSVTGVRGEARNWTDAVVNNRGFRNTGLTHNTLKDGNATDAWFCSFWIRFTSDTQAAARRRIFCTESISANAGVWSFELTAGTAPMTMVMRTHTGSANDLSASLASAVPLNTWVHVVGGYQNLRFWVATGTTSAPQWSARDTNDNNITPNATALAQVLRLGGYTGNDTLQAASVDQLCIFRGAMDADGKVEQDLIDLLYGGGDGVDWPSVIAVGGSNGNTMASGLGLGLGYD